MKVIIILYILINLYSFFLMFIDKQRARQNKWRISENHIWISSILGGALGATFGMKQFHHKTKHKKFVILLPLLTIFTLVAYIYILLNLS